MPESGELSKQNVYRIGDTAAKNRIRAGFPVVHASFPGYNSSMIQSVKVQKPFKDYREFKRLYDASFPDNERIPFLRLYTQMDETRVFYAYYEKEKLIGLSFFYLLDDLAYLSYLAVEEKLRGQGYGSKILQRIKEDYRDCRIVLDIEEVKEDAGNYEERRKRKDFYLHNGFVSAGIFYHIYHVDYEILVANGTACKEDWHRIISRYWGKFADNAVYKEKR